MIEYQLAGPADDGAVRRLLAAQGMPAWVELTLEREPSFFAEATDRDAEYAVLARAAGEAEPIGMYTCATHPVYRNGHAARVGYLGGLRVVPRWRRRARLLRDGYASIGRLIPGQSAAGFWYTSVAEDNDGARRLLERGLPGLPTYRCVGALATLAIATAQAREACTLRRAQHTDVDELLAFHRNRAIGHNFSAVLDAERIERIGIGNFLLHGAPGRLRGCVALWDRRTSRQIVAHRYRGPLRHLRLAYNALARPLRRVRLPPPGAALECHFLAFAASAGDARDLAHLLRAALAYGPSPVALVGVPADGPLHRALARIASFTYRTRIYTVSFGAPPEVDDRPVHPEVALL